VLDGSDRQAGTARQADDGIGRLQRGIALAGLLQLSEQLLLAVCERKERDEVETCSARGFDSPKRSDR